MRLSKKMAISAVLIFEIIVFAMAVVPLHASADASHDSCEICGLIHHPPVIQGTDLHSIGLFLQPELVDIEAPQLTKEYQAAARSSRAPPSRIW